jgi:PAS domain S-box-containing protein
MPPAPPTPLAVHAPHLRGDDLRRAWMAVRSWGWQIHAALGYVLVHIVWVVFDPTPASWREQIGNAWFFPVGFVTAAMCWRNARDTRLDARARRGWLLLGTSYFILGLTTNAWTIDDLVFGHAKKLQWFLDAGALANFAALGLGFLCFSTRVRAREARLKMALDFAIVLVGAATLIWYFMLRPRYVAAATSTYEVFAALEAPCLSLAMLLAISLVFIRGSGGISDTALRIICAGEIVLVVAEIAYTPLAIDKSYRAGHPIDLLWMLGDALTFCGAAWQSRRGAVAPPAEARPRNRFTRLPYLFIGAGFLPVVDAAFDWSASDRVVLLATLVLVLAVVARQYIAMRDNERLSAERELQEARFRSLVQHASDAVIIVDAEGCVRYQSPSIERLLGYPPTHGIGEPLAGVVHPADVVELTRFLAQARATGASTAPARWRICHRNGSWLELETVATDLLHDPAVAGVVLNVRDVSERVALERQLLQAQKMEAVGRLAGGIAHDFNNLLTAIRMTAALVADELPTGSPLVDELREIERSVDRGSSLTRQLLAFSKKELIQPTLLDVAEVVAGIEPMLRRLMATDITLDIRATLQPWRVLADRGQLEQVVMNLVINARDAMPGHGTITVAVGVTTVDVATARANPGLLPREYVTLTVRDTGSGMTPDVQAHLFEPFFTTKAVGKGTGLGLSTVYAIVQQCGGAISVRSVVDEGSVFTVYLPRAVTLDTPVEPVKAYAGSGGGRETILVVDDEETVRAAVRRILQKYGYEVLTAAGGAEALELLQREGSRVALLLTDMVMPVMSGRELVERAAAAHPGLRMIVMSGHTDDEALRQGQLATEDAFISKPFTVHDLTATIRRVLDGTSTRATRAGAPTG